MTSKGTSLWSIIAIVGICGLISAVLFPIFVRPSRFSQCQFNLNQLGKAIKTYMTDYNDQFPTNRLLNGKVSSHVQLTPDNEENKVFQNGVNWVEALYPYVEKVGNPGDNCTVWKCPDAIKEKADGDSSVSTYAFNINLVGQPEGIIRDAGHTMLLREMDRLYGAVCRPIDISKDGKTRPIGAFLTGYNPQLPKGTLIKQPLHGPGSNIIFTDSHVKNVHNMQMPTDNKLYWDRETKQWWNSEKKQIAITP